VGVNRHPRSKHVAKKPWRRGLVKRVYYRKCRSLDSLFHYYQDNSPTCAGVLVSVSLLFASATVDARKELDPKCVPYA